MSSRKKISQFLSKFVVSNQIKNYNLNKFRYDLQSGMTVGIMLIPQAMAYSMIAGLPPVYGLYACIFPLLIYPFIGTSRHIALGIIAVDMVIISASVSNIAQSGSAEYIMLVALLALMVGLIQIIMSAARLGFLINYLSRPVINGFTMAAALIIVSGQLGNLLGVKVSQSAYFFDTLKLVFIKIGEIDHLTLLLGGGSIILIILIKYWKSMFPTSLVIIILGIVLGWWLNLPEKGVNVVGEIPSGFPDLRLPSLNLSSFRELLTTAITLALVQFMTIITLGKTYGKEHNYSIDSNQELLALGAGNIINGFFQALPSSASFSRSAVNAESGARTSLSNIFAAAVVILTLLFLTPIFYYLPYCSLAAVVIVAGVNLIDIKAISYLYKTKKRDFFIAMFTFVITLLIGIQEGILLGITASLLAILYRMSTPNVAELGHLPGTRSFKDIERYSDAEQFEKILILRVDASFSFANAEYFKDNILKKSTGRDGTIEAVILDCSAINDLDTTALEAMGKIISTLKERKVELYLAGIKGPVRDVMKKAGLYENLGPNKRIFRTPYRAILDILANWHEASGSELLGHHYKDTDEFVDKKEKDIDHTQYEPDDKT